jgi:hypothetical protein
MIAFLALLLAAQPAAFRPVLNDPFPILSCDFRVIPAKAGTHEHGACRAGVELGAFSSR